MQDRSASDRSQPADPATSGPADRLSLTVSVMLIGGLVMASVALYQDAKLDKPKQPTKPAAPVVRQYPAQPAAPPSSGTAMMIKLPPPPIRSVAPAGPVVKRMTVTKLTVTPHRPVLKPLKRAVEKPLAVKPLTRADTIKPGPIPAPKPAGKIKPLKPVEPVAKKPVAKKLAAADPTPVREQAKRTAQTAKKPVVDGTRNRKAGGALLRLLEHGQGPTIEIAWPRRAAARRALYRQLTHCFGVKAAVLVEDSRLYEAAGEAGESWSIDMDRFSGFIRSPQGEAIAEETRVFASIADHHGVVDWRPVRVFPRSVDAALLGGLGAVLGAQYKSAKQIRAAYRWDRTRLVLDDFTVDGRPLAGSVTLPLPRGWTRRPGCD